MHTYLLLFSLCQVALENVANNNGFKDLNTSPRLDSILQFSVMITDIFEDSKGNFQFGSHGDGLCRYDGERYTYFTVHFGLPTGLVREIAPGPDWSKTKKINGGNQISSIQEDQNGVIWLRNADDIICRFDGKKFLVVHPNKKNTLITNRTDKEWKTELNYLWLPGWGKSGVYRYDGNKLEHLIFPPPYTNMGSVSEVYKNKDGNIWFGTMDYGTFPYDGKSFTLMNKNDEIGICRSVFQDNRGRTWITNKGGFGLYYLKGDKLINFSKEYSLNHNNDSLSKEFNQNGIQPIEQDQNGALWFGTFGNGL